MGYGAQLFPRPGVEGLELGHGFDACHEVNHRLENETSIRAHGKPSSTKRTRRRMLDVILNFFVTGCKRPLYGPASLQLDRSCVP
jgi:hypothetical protein